MLAQDGSVNNTDHERKAYLCNKKLRKLILIILLYTIREVTAQFPLSYKSAGNNMGIPFRIENGYDSSILLSGYHHVLSIYDGAEITKLDANGKKLWDRNFKTKVFNQQVGFVQAKDGGYYIFGTSYLHDSLGDAFLCKLNACAEVEWGQIFRLPEWNFIINVSEISHNNLLITQSGNSFRISELLYSHIGIYDITLQKYERQFLIPVEPLYRKTVKHNSLFYNFNTWEFVDVNDPGIYHLGSSQVAYDTTLTHFKIKYFKPFELANTHPLIWVPPILLNSGNLLSGGSLVGLRTDMAYQMAFVKYDINLNRIGYKDMGHVRGASAIEFVETMHSVSNDQFIAGVNYQPEGDYLTTKNSQAEFYLIDTNFNELKKITYGDTLNYKYYIYDAIEFYDKNILVLMHKHQNFGNVAYELAKFDKSLNLVTATTPSKKYDYKCNKKIDTSDFIDLGNFDSLAMTGWNTVAWSSGVEDLYMTGAFARLFPNPTQGGIHIGFDSQQTGQITIYNTLGQSIHKSEFEERQDLSFFLPMIASGLIYIKIETQDFTTVKKVMVNPVH
jgi:hypothetical protein